MSKFFRNITIILILILLGFSPAYSQSKNLFEDLQSNSGNKGQIKIVQSDSLTRLINMHLWDESKKSGIIGYRIRIYRGTGPTAAKELEEARGKFLRVADDVPDYTGYDPPYYLFEVGDFRTYSDALKFMKHIEKYYPNQLYIFKTTISNPKL